MNHWILLFEFFIYQFQNHSFAINIYKFKLFTMSVQTVEQKVAFRNNKLTLHFDKQEPILHTLIYKITATAILTLMQRKSLLKKYLPLPNLDVIARQSVSICMLLQSGVLSEKQSKQRSFLCALAFCCDTFCKNNCTILFAGLCIDLALGGRGAGACPMGRRCAIFILLLLIK